MTGRARDLLTDAAGAGTVVGVASVVLRVDGQTHVLHEIASMPRLDTLDLLVGAVVGPGFRARFQSLVPEQQHASSLLHLLLDDLPGAALVSGYALLHDGAVRAGHRPDEYLDVRADMCAGWARDATMIVTLQTEGRMPAPMGPVAPELERPGDPLGWHQLGPLPPKSTRRLRRLDVVAPARGAATTTVDVFFRDSHFDDDGAETVVHEYSVDATVDLGSRTIAAIEARADVLPWKECPAAIGSAGRLVGHTLAGLRTHVRQTFTGTSTCTHLNDVLRGLADVDALLDRVSS